MVGIGYISSPNLNPVAIANDVSGDGSVVVGNCNRGAFYWDEGGGLRPLMNVILERGFESTLSDWYFKDATAITPDGKTIVGCGTVPGKTDMQAWRVRLP
jgi:uncharacterized membrane protein